jgi:hypothetical protein
MASLGPLELFRMISQCLERLELVIIFSLERLELAIIFSLESLELVIFVC